MFCIINAFKIIETSRGNEYESAIIKIKYIENLLITEHINIFNIIRTPIYYDFVKYFWKFNENIDQQNMDTKLDLNEYLSQTENVSQEIIIIMVFNIEATKENIMKKKDILYNLLKINNMDEEIFNII